LYVDQGICTGGYRVEVAKEVENPVDLENGEVLSPLPARGRSKEESMPAISDAGARQDEQLQ
jgi:hypothetical protein